MATVFAASPSSPRRRRFKPQDRPLVALGLYGSFALLVLLPVIITMLWGIADGWAPPALIPRAYTLDHWREVTDTGSGIVISLITSLLIATVVTILTVIVAFPTAWAMARFPFRVKRAVEVFVLAPLIVPGLVVAVGIGRVFIGFGLAYSVPDVVLVQMVGTLPMMIRLLAAALESIPEELSDAARSLGAGWVNTLLHVILPLSLPGLMAGGLLSFVGSFEEFDKSFVVGAPVVQTLPIRLYTYLDPYTLQLPLASVVAIFLLLPGVVVFVIAGRIMRDDILASGMGKV